MIMNSNLDNNPAINNILRFLKSKQSDLMEHCYYSIRDNKNYRYFNDTIDNIEDKEFDSLFPLVSIVILTANKIECDSLNYIILSRKNYLKKRKHALSIFKNSDILAPDAYIFKISLSSSFILHINACETGSNTPGGSTDLVRFIMQKPLLRPSYIISFGICYGRDPNEQNIGDVLIPRKLYPWSIGQKITESNFKIKNDDLNLCLEEKFSNSGIYSILRSFCNGEDGKKVTDVLCLKNKNQLEAQDTFMINVMYGNMSTGEAVISSQKAKNKIQKANNNEKEIGGEMEGYGLAKECIYYADIPCFIVKAICDWGECKDIDKFLKQKKILRPEHLKDQLQAYAAFCAGVVLYKLFNDEKEKFLSLNLVNWMISEHEIRKCIGTKEEKFIISIEDYFKINKEIAENIFKLMINNKIVKSCQTKKDTYFIKYEVDE